MTLFGFVNEVSLRGSGGQELFDDNKKVFVKSAMIRYQMSHYVIKCVTSFMDDL